MRSCIWRLSYLFPERAFVLNIVFNLNYLTTSALCPIIFQIIHILTKKYLYLYHQNTCFQLSNARSSSEKQLIICYLCTAQVARSVVGQKIDNVQQLLSKTRASNNYNGKQTFKNIKIKMNMMKSDQCITSTEFSRLALDNNQQESKENLFHLQSEENQKTESLIKKKMKSFRKVFKKKTPAEILKENILKNRQIQRARSLRSITSDNLKLFVRLQEQKSSYNFTQLHKQQSCSILPLSKSNATSRLQSEFSLHTQNERCASAAPSLKFKCKTLKHNITSSNSTSRTLKIINNSENSQNATQIFASRAVSKLSFLPDKIEKEDKENMVSNKISRITGHLSESQEEKLIMKKIGSQIAIHRSRIVNKYQINDKIFKNSQFSIKTRPQTSKTLHSKPVRHILGEVNLQSNII